MEILNVVAMIVAAVIAFNAVSYTDQISNSTDVYYPNGTIETLDLTTEPEDSASTSAELREAVIFVLCTELNQSTGEQLYVQNIDALSASNFNPSNPTRLLIHGWVNSMESPSETLIRDAYLSVGECNVILVDWSFYADNGYLYARTKIVTVGEYVGKMIDFLVENGASLDDMIIVGHSLGAHVAGVAGRSASNTVGAVVGLDPAGPLFYFVDTVARIKSTDAGFVEVIHTNAGSLGYNGVLGIADYWPNGGKEQPGCGLDIISVCSHCKSFAYFAESIILNNNDYASYACESYSDFESGECDSASSSHMGGSILDVDASGSYYLDTNSEAPFARGDVGPDDTDVFTLLISDMSLDTV